MNLERGLAQGQGGDLSDFQIYQTERSRRYAKPRDGLRPRTFRKFGVKAMGYDTRIEMTGHGFRAMVYTPPREKLKYPKGVVDFQLAHGHGEDCYKGAHA
ncbi:MAG: hypothetical protein LBI87_01795 [Candidatus Accumulibacter sp.]|nr:hypothetical protein [Accumulibacter sp.]